MVFISGDSRQEGCVYAPGDKIELDITLGPGGKIDGKEDTGHSTAECCRFLRNPRQGRRDNGAEQESLATGLRSHLEPGRPAQGTQHKETNNQIVAEIDGPQTSDKRAG